MNKNMITGSWGDVTLVCEHRHEHPIEMVIQEGPSSLFYACPKYRPENRSADERACNNRLNLVDYTNMLEHIHEKIIDAALNDEILHLENYKWKDRKGTEYKVLKQDGDKMTISVLNNKAIKS